MNQELFLWTMSHHVWNDNENIFVITGRLGSRWLAIKRGDTMNGGHLKCISIDDDIVPDDIKFKQCLYTEAARIWDQKFIGFRITIRGKQVDVEDSVWGKYNIEFISNEYVKPANMISEFASRFGMIGESDEEVRDQVIKHLDYVKILESNGLIDLVKDNYEKAQRIKQLELQIANLTRRNEDLEEDLIVERSDHSESNIRLQALEAERADFKNAIMEKVKTAFNF